MSEAESTRAFVKALFATDDAEPAPVVVATPQPITGPVIPGQELAPHEVTENPMRAYTRELFGQE